MSKVSSARLTILATEINSLLRTMATTAFELGSRLTEAREAFEKAGEFYAWADENCSVKKAYACRLMSVYKAFKDDADLSQQPITVLAALLAIKDEAVREEVKEVVKAVAGTDNPMTEKDVKEMAEEIAPTEGKPEPKEMTVKQAEKLVEKAEKKAELLEQKLKSQAEKLNAARDKAIKDNRDLLKELEKAQATIDQQAARIAELEALLAGKSDESEEPEEITQQADDDMPWADDEPEEENTADAGDLLEAMKVIYDELNAANPRAMVNNTIIAAEQVGIIVHKQGRKQSFVIDGEEINGTDLRTMLKQL